MQVQCGLPAHCFGLRGSHDCYMTSTPVSQGHATMRKQCFRIYSLGRASSKNLKFSLYKKLSQYCWLHSHGYSSTQETLTATRLQFSQLSTIVVICGLSFFLLLMHWSPQVCPPVKQKCLWFLQHERIPVVYEAWYPPNLLKVTSLTLGPFGKV